MKKLLLIAAIALFGMTAQAQTEKGDMAAGINLSYASKSWTPNFGIGAKFQYNILDKLRIEPSANYFLKKDHVSMWDINANVHYLFGLGEKFNLYPLAGFAFVGWKAGEGEYSVSDTKFGFNIGAGGEYLLTEKLALSLEIKYQIVSDLDRPIFSLGVAYKF